MKKNRKLSLRKMTVAAIHTSFKIKGGAANLSNTQPCQNTTDNTNGGTLVIHTEEETCNCITNQCGDTATVTTQDDGNTTLCPDTDLCGNTGPRCLM